MGKKILVAYASVSGSTGEVAEAIGQVLRQGGAEVDVCPVGEATGIRGYDGLVLGSSIRAGRWLPEATHFLEKHQADLQAAPVAYFTTCLTMVNDTADSRRTVLAYLEPVLQTAPHVEPIGLGLFAGSLDSTRELMMPTNLGPQGDYRDWAAIRAWAEEIRPALLGGETGAEESVILGEAIQRRADLSGADLGELDLRGADLRETDFHEANLHRANLSWADLNWSDMSGADLSRVNLIGGDLQKANLIEANLSWSILNGANLSQANLSGANLSYADLNWVDLRQADLSYADLSGANLGWADLRGANLSHAKLNRAIYNSQTEWPEDFSPRAHGCIFVGGSR